MGSVDECDGEVVQEYYRGVLPDGSVWVESRSLDEVRQHMKKPQAKGGHILTMRVVQHCTPWEPLAE